MAFGIGDGIKKTEAGELKGKQMEIACECWFTSKGRIKPLLLKFKNERDEIETLSEIQVNYTEQKNYLGIPSMEYQCSVMIEGSCKEVKLIFFQEECRWVMVL